MQLIALLGVVRRALACNRSYLTRIQQYLKYFGESFVKSILTGVQFIAHLDKLRCVPRRARAIARLSW